MGILAVEDGSIDVENLEEEGLSPGKVLIYRQGSNSPKLLSSDSLPLDFQTEEKNLINEFVNISGISDIFQSGEVVSGNISGVALQLLIEQEESKLVASAEEIRNCAKEMAKQILRLYKQYALIAHTSRLIGDNGSIELFYWKGSEINSEEVIFETENEINESLAQKRSMIFEVLNAGLLHDENGRLSNSMRSRILEQLGFGVWETNQDIKSLQTNNASRENLMLITDQVIGEPKEIDDHDIHVSEHVAFMLGIEFEKATKKHPNINEQMLNHIRTHKKFKQAIEENNIDKE